MRFDSDRRLANLLKRTYAQIDEACADALGELDGMATQALDVQHYRFNTAARSIGQSRRQRNLKGSRQ